MDDRHERIKKYAYEIWLYRCNSAIWDYGRKGTQDGDWFQACHYVDAEDKAKKIVEGE